MNALVSVMTVAFLVVIPQAKATDNCMCGVFRYGVARGDPIISRSPGVTTECNADGLLDCHQKCVLLAKASKDQAPAVLCGALKNDDRFVPTVYFKSCSNDWEYAGLTSDKPICCQGGNGSFCED